MKVLFFYTNNNLNMLMKKLIKHFLGNEEDKRPDFFKVYKEFCLNKGMLNAKDISGTILYLLSDLSEFVNGQNIVVDDGFTL